MPRRAPTHPQILLGRNIISSSHHPTKKTFNNSKQAGSRTRRRTCVVLLYNRTLLPFLLHKAKPDPSPIIPTQTEQRGGELRQAFNRQPQSKDQGRRGGGEEGGGRRDLLHCSPTICVCCPKLATRFRPRIPSWAGGCGLYLVFFLPQCQRRHGQVRTAIFLDFWCLRHAMSVKVYYVLMSAVRSRLFLLFYHDPQDLLLFPS